MKIMDSSGLMLLTCSTYTPSRRIMDAWMYHSENIEKYTTQNMGRNPTTRLTRSRRETEEAEYVFCVWDSVEERREER